MCQVGLSERMIHLFITNEVNNAFSNLPQTKRNYIVNLSKDYIKSNNTNNNELQELENHNYVNLIENIKSILNENQNSYTVNESQINVNERYKRNTKWTKIEDLRLLCGAIKYDAKNWKAISAFVGYNRTSGQCNQRWNRSVCPEILHTKWTENEDRILMNLVEVQKFNKWKQVSKFIPGRTDLQCRYRYTQLTKGDICHGEDDEKENSEPNISKAPSTQSKLILPNICSLNNTMNTKPNINASPVLPSKDNNEQKSKIFIKSTYKKIIVKPEDIK